MSTFVRFLFSMLSEKRHYTHEQKCLRKKKFRTTFDNHWATPFLFLPRKYSQIISLLPYAQIYFVYTDVSAQFYFKGHLHELIKCPFQLEFRAVCSKSLSFSAENRRFSSSCKRSLKDEYQVSYCVLVFVLQAYEDFPPEGFPNVLYVIKNKSYEEKLMQTVRITICNCCCWL